MEIIPKLSGGDVVARLNGKKELCAECSNKCLFHKGTAVSVWPNVARIEWKKQKPFGECIAVYLVAWLKMFFILAVALTAYTIQNY